MRKGSALTIWDPMRSATKVLDCTSMVVLAAPPRKAGISTMNWLETPSGIKTSQTLEATTRQLPIANNTWKRRRHCLSMKDVLNSMDHVAPKRLVCNDWPSRGQQVLHIRGESKESISCRQWSMQGRDSPWLRNPGQISLEVQNRGISGPTKRTYSSPQKLKETCFK